MPLPTPPPPATPVDLDLRSRSVQLAFAFLLGIVVAVLGVRFSGGRFTRPLDLDPVSIATHRVDLNHASLGELRQLPGVGPALADRIADARPFASADDLKNVQGMGPSTMARVQPYVGVSEPGMGPIVKSLAGPIDPNTAPLEDLQRLPGIGPKLAQRIIDERTRKPFARVEDMRRVSGIGPKTVEKLRASLIFASSSPVARTADE